MEPSIDYIFIIRSSDGKVISSRDKTKKKDTPAAVEALNIQKLMLQEGMNDAGRTKHNGSEGREWVGTCDSKGVIYACCTRGFDNPRLPHQLLDV